MTITSRDTKTEILKAYDQLLQEKEQLDARVAQLLKEKQAPKKETAKAAGQERPAVPSTIDHIIATLSVLRPGFGDAVSELSAKLLSEASKLAELRRDVEKEIQRLESLHGLQVTDGTLEQLIQEYTEKSTAFEAEAGQRQEAFEQEMAEKRKTWQKEQAQHARFIKERDDTTKKAEQREAAEYKYDLELQRKLDNDQYDQQQAQLQKALEDFEEAKKKELDERDMQVIHQEMEWGDLERAVKQFPKELETAVKKAKEEGTKLARRPTKMKADLRAKEAEGERRVSELKIQSLEDSIKKQLQQLNNLSKQLDAAVKQAQDLAVKAIEGASNVSSLQAVREIALEQAKNIQKGK